MSQEICNEKDLWESVTDLLGNKEINLSPTLTSQFYESPQEISKQLSRYKWVAKLACTSKSIIEFGCREALASPILSENSSQYLGVDANEEAIEFASIHFTSKKRSFIAKNYLGKNFGIFDTVVALNEYDKHYPDKTEEFLQTVNSHFEKDGVFAVGTSHKSRVQGLSNVLAKYFHNILPFSFSGETARPGIMQNCDYWLMLACCGKENA